VKLSAVSTQEPTRCDAVRRPATRRTGLVAALVLVSGALLAGCGADGAAEPVRTYTLRLRTDDSGPEYEYIAEDELDLRVGDEVTFEFDNTGSLPHDVQVVDPSGAQVGVSTVANPGATTSVTVLFEEAGFFRLNCLVDDHLTAHGMQAIVEVTEA
jgi:plastocyanin